jgi:hypothetical protein
MYKLNTFWERIKFLPDEFDPGILGGHPKAAIDGRLKSGQR